MDSFQTVELGPTFSINKYIVALDVSAEQARIFNKVLLESYKISRMNYYITIKQE